MRINQQAKQIELEPRDINFVLQAYVRSYLFFNRNEDPIRIILPMYASVPHPLKAGVIVPIEYVPDTSAMAVEIIRDGSNVPESTVESEHTADEMDKKYKAMQERIKELEALLPGVDIPTATLSPAKAAFASQPTPERLAKVKQPDKPAPAGSVADYGSSRDSKIDLRQAARDLAPEKEINEAEEKDASDIAARAKKVK